MKKLINAFIATALMSAFSFPAFAEGVDHVSTDGAICGERAAGKDIKDDSTKASDSNETTVNSN